MGWLSSHFSHDLSMLGLHGHRNGSDGSDGNGMPFRYAMSPGDTVGGLARSLGLTVDALLGVNPGLRVDTPLTPGMQLNLPASGTAQAPYDGADGTNPGQVQRDLPPGQNWHELPSTASLPRSFTVVLAGSPQQVGIQAAGTPANDANGAMAGRALSSASSLSAGAVPASATTAYSAQLVRSTGPASANGQTLSYAQAAGLLMQAGASQRTDDDRLPPPPLPPSGVDRAPPVTQAMPLQASWAPSPSVSWSIVPVAAGNDDAKLQIMALLVAQLGGSTMASSASVMPQGPAFIDPQALAAQAASLRAGRVIDLGAGRSMQVSLVNDRLGRIDAIGQEGQAARRTGDGLDALRAQQEEPDEEAALTDEQREDGRRRRAAVAAMRRRRRALSVRCRYRSGPRQPLRTDGGVRYPSGVDLAEFRSRQLPRYLWQRRAHGAAEGNDRP